MAKDPHGDSGSGRKLISLSPFPSLRAMAEDPHGGDRFGRELTGPAVREEQRLSRRESSTTVASSDNLGCNEQGQPQSHTVSQDPGPHRHERSAPTWRLETIVYSGVYNGALSMA